MEKNLTPQNENDKKLGFNLEFEINSDKNNIFSLILNADTFSYLNIKATKKNDLFKKSFSNQFSVGIIKENKYFNMFDDLREICNEISERIKKKEIKLVENLNNLNFYISLPTTKIKEISFELKEEEKNDKDKIKYLTILMQKMQEEINEIKINHSKEIEENKKEINDLKNIINNQNNEINELKKKVNAFINYIENKDELKNSKIINNNIDYISLIKGWIQPNIKIEGELLYRLSKDGDKISKFHELCDDKGPTLTLFETTDGNKGGIYTPLSWDNRSKWKNDLETFIFNLNKNQKYKKFRTEFSIYCLNSYGPWIANFGFKNDEQMNKIQHEGNNINSYYENGTQILPNNGGGVKFFDIKEVEVYKIKKL